MHSTINLPEPTAACHANRRARVTHPDRLVEEREQEDHAADLFAVHAVAGDVIGVTSSRRVDRGESSGLARVTAAAHEAGNNVGGTSRRHAPL